MKTLLAAIFVIGMISSNAQHRATVQLFKSEELQLLPGPFAEAEQTDLRYILALDADHLLAPYRRECGLPAKGPSYGNWENSGLDGHIGGHYLSALAMMYARTRDKDIKKRLDYFLFALKECQDSYGDGYIGGVPGSKELWKTIMAGNVEAIKQKWVPLYNIHKIYAGLRDAWVITDNQLAKLMFIRFSDWFVTLAQHLTSAQMEELLRTEHGGVNEVLADAFQLTGKKEYLAAAYAFSQKAILQPLEKNKDSLTNLHANTQIPKVVGFKRIATVNKDTAYDHAAAFFWERVTRFRSVAVGGNSVSEHFNPIDNFSGMINSEEGPETCNTYNMLKLTSMLFQSTVAVKYIDYYERALYNHILSTQLPDKGGFVYFTPMRPGHYRVYSQPSTSMWCCVGSGMENHAKYPELIYAHDQEDLYVNLFIASRLNWKEKKLVIQQETVFPEEEKTVITIKAAKGGIFSIHLRYPSWVAPGALTVMVNGKEQKIDANPGSFHRLRRAWKKGDRIEVNLPMHTSTEYLPDGSNYLAFVQGPIVLAARTDTTAMTGLFADDSRMGHVAKGKKLPLSEMPMLVSTDSDLTRYLQRKAGKSMTFTAGKIIYPARYSSLELIPFYRIGASRYVIYWEKETPASLQLKQDSIAKSELVAAALAGITIDLVKAGEQQPESDHFIKTDRSRTGVDKDRHWREATGWFSYQLTDTEKRSAKLQVVFASREKTRQFSITINDQFLADVTTSKTGEPFYKIEYPVPQALLKESNGLLTVKFVAKDNSVAGPVVELRLLTE